MTTWTLEHLRAEAMKLPEAERRELARCLQATLDDDDFGDHMLPEWHDEIARRVQSIRDGTAKCIPAEDVIAEMRARLGR